MAPTPHRIAQTSTELKKQYKKNGASVSERQQKQLERGHELDLRASRMREAEQRRKAAVQKRKEREEKEKAVRKQLGVGLATQMIGYSHTQAQLKNGMEAFLGVKQRKEEERRRKELELTKKLEQIAQEVEKEPWDDDDTGNIVAELPELPPKPKEVIDNDLDDNALIEAHDVVTSDPMEPPPVEAEKVTCATPTTTLPSIQSTKEDAKFTRLHGPVNKAIEKVLEKLPEPLIELLSQDVSLKLPDWEPAPGLLHKLNPLGLPPHRLRVKVGSVVVLLRDLNTSSQLSKSQHLRILRAEKDRLECLVLDGQLEGTKTLLTRVPFHAKYRNEDQFPFQRSQFPIRIATDYTALAPSRETSQTGFKMPAIPGRSTSSSHNKLNLRPRPRPPMAILPCNTNPSFKLPGLPASKLATASTNLTPDPVVDLDGWDDFLESGTQIARELSPEILPGRTATKPTLKPLIPAIRRLGVAESLPPFSTQDLDFSIDELDEQEETVPSKIPDKALSTVSSGLQVAPKEEERPKSAPPPNVDRAPYAVLRTVEKPRPKSARPLPRRQDANNSSTLLDLSNLRASQRPPSVSDRPGLKRKTWVPPPEKRMPPAKRQSLPSLSAPRVSLPTIPNNTRNTFDDFMISTQEAASFFADDDELSLGSPPIAV